MFRRALIPCFVVVAIVCGSAAAEAQWVVHALGGTVESMQPARKTMYVITDDGSSGDFQFPQTPNVNVNFDKDIRSETMTTDKFNGQGHHVVLFYFGDDRVRTAFAVQDLGTGPFVKVTGTVVSFNKHDHSITMLTKEGSQQEFLVSNKTVVDTPDGVTLGRKFKADKGDHLRLLAETVNGQQQVMLIRTSGIDTSI